MKSQEIDQGHIFISFTSADKDVVVPIIKRLRRHRFVVWTYLENPGGTRYPPVIEERIRTCSVFVVMVSCAAAVSENVQQEVHLAFTHKRIRLPVIIDSDAKDAFEFENTGIVRISLSKGVDDPNFSQLVASIKKWDPLRRRGPENRNVEQAAEDLGWLLPHLVDRTRQELVLKTYVHAVLARKICQPGIFLLRGREDECGDVFIERIAKRAMPEVLRRTSLGEYVHFHQVDWPSHDDDVSGEARYQTLISSIHAALSSAGRAQGIVLRVQLPVDGWGGRADRALLKKFVHHWRDPLNGLSTHTPLVMIADVSYGTGVLGSWWGRWVLRRTNRVFRTETPFLARTRNLVRGWSWREVFRWSSHVLATENSGHAINQARPVAALPKLTRVSHTDAMKWVHEHRSALKKRDPTDARLALASHFRRRLGLGNRRIPMEKAVVALRSLLTDASASGAAI